MTNKLLATLLFFLCTSLVFGQGKFFDEIHEEVKAKKNPSGIQSSAEFKTLWEGGQLNGEQKKRFVELIVALKEVGFQSLPHIYKT